MIFFGFICFIFSISQFLLFQICANFTCQLFAYYIYQGFKISEKVSFYHLSDFPPPHFFIVSQCQQLLMSLGTDGLWEDCWVRYSASWSQTAQFIWWKKGYRNDNWYKSYQTREWKIMNNCMENIKLKDFLMKSWHFLQKKMQQLQEVWMVLRWLTYWQCFSYLYFNKSLQFSLRMMTMWETLYRGKNLIMFLV